MQKDFDRWNEIKKSLEERRSVFCNTREIWWCSVGMNVGSETSGKNELFERPVLILRVYNVESIMVVPLTSKAKKDPFHTSLEYEGRIGWAILSHTKTINSRRLQRKLCRIDEMQFMSVLSQLKQLIFIDSRNKSAPENPEPRSPKA